MFRRINANAYVRQFCHQDELLTVVNDGCLAYEKCFAGKDYHKTDHPGMARSNVIVRFRAYWPNTDSVNLIRRCER